MNKDWIKMAGGSGSQCDICKSTLEGSCHSDYLIFIYYYFFYMCSVFLLIFNS